MIVSLFIMIDRGNVSLYSRFNVLIDKGEILYQLGGNHHLYYYDHIKENLKTIQKKKEKGVRL